MKNANNLLILFLSFSVLTATSCKKDDEDNRSSGGGGGGNNTASIAPYVANWKLVRHETVLNVGPQRDW